MKKIKGIAYPNTCEMSVRYLYFTDDDILQRFHCHLIQQKVDEIRQVTKNGEMALINWFQVIKDGKIIAEIKESVCDIYGLDDIEKENDCPF